MKKAKASKSYLEMTTSELRHATKQFDEEFVAETSRPLTADEQAFWDSVKAKDHQVNGKSAATITVRLERDLLKRCSALAKKKRVSRDALIARSLRALLAAETE